MSSLSDIDDALFTFKLLQEDDIPLLCSWVKQPEVARWWYESDLDWPSFLSKYRDKLSKGVAFPFLVCFDGQPIGYIEYYIANKVGDGWWPDLPSGVYGIDVFIGEAQKLGRGYGSIFIRKFIDMLAEKSEVKKIILDAAVDNLRAIRCYEKVGFSPVKQVVTPLGKALLMEFPLPGHRYVRVDIPSIVFKTR